MKKITGTLLTLAALGLVLVALAPVVQHATDGAIDGVAAARSAREAELAKQEAVRTWQQQQQAQLDVEVAKATADTATELAPVWQTMTLVVALALAGAAVMLAYGLVSAAVTAAKVRATLIHADKDRVSSAFPLVTTPSGIIALPPPALASRREAITPALPAPITTTPLLPTAGTWSELRQSFTPTADRLMLGVSLDGPIYAPITGLLSTLVIGRPGSGKTSLLRLIATEAVEAGVRVVCWDLHSDLNVAGVELATTEEDIAASAEAITTELDARRRNGRGAPICLMADELPLLATVPAAMATIKRVVLEGRKYAIYCLLSGQAVPASIFDGGAMVRSACASRFVFRSNRMEARRSGLEDRLDMANVNTLPTGVAILDGACVTRPTLVSIPRLDGGAPAVVMAPRPTTGTADPADEVRRIRELHANGMSLSAICRTVYGTNGGAGFYAVRRALGLDV